ncbi:MAG: hypothetical protein QG599_106 [Pseudomonadota bacterium]|nr:hypothetical protein [Pseudomonadota bacterium]
MKLYTLYERRAVSRAGKESPDDWPRWDLYQEPQDEGGPNPYYDVAYLPVVVETDLTPVMYGGGGIEWQDDLGSALTTDDAEAQGRLKIRL